MRKMEHRRNQVAGTCDRGLKIPTHAEIEDVRIELLFEARCSSRSRAMATQKKFLATDVTVKT